ncbi:hypothetical protein BH10ACI1_BH10ACI1_12640 [soil metagenome]
MISNREQKNSNISDDDKETLDNQNQPKRHTSNLSWIQGFGYFFLVLACLVLIYSVGYEIFLEIKPATPSNDELLFGLERGIFIAIAFIIVAFICFLLYAGFLLFFSKDKENSYRFFLYQLIAFGVLMLSLRAFGIHHTPKKNKLFAANVEDQSANSNSNTNAKKPNKSDDAQELEDTTRNISEMAAIMILFLLAELAAFIAHDLNKTKTMVEQLGETAETAATGVNTASEKLSVNLLKLSETTEKIDSVREVAGVQALDSKVRDNAIKLINAWSEKLKDGNQSNSGKIWQILLKEYFEEEFLEFSNDKEIEIRIPKSVKPIENTKKEDVSYIATSVGFYAHLLSKIVDGFSDQESVDITTNSQTPTAEKDTLCMAIITNALPAHCWNWSKDDGSWSQYEPIDDYRESMLKAVNNAAKIDRVILVFEEEQDAESKEIKETQASMSFDPLLYETQNGIYWKHKLLEEMKSNWFMVEPEDKEQSATLRIPENGNCHKDSLLHKLKPKFPFPISKATTVEEEKIYPMVIEDNSPLSNIELKELNNDLWKKVKLLDKYKELHAKQGNAWVLKLQPNQLNLFKGRHDIMFIGRGSKKERDENAGLWYKTKTNQIQIPCDWDVCLMSSMNSKNETMFLTVVTGESVNDHFEYFQTQLDSVMGWNESLLEEEGSKKIGE